MTVPPSTPGRGRVQMKRKEREQQLVQRQAELAQQAKHMQAERQAALEVDLGAPTVHCANALTCHTCYVRQQLYRTAQLYTKQLGR